MAVCVLRVIVPDYATGAGATAAPAGATATDDDGAAGAPPAKKRKTTKKAPAGIRSFLAGAEKLQEAQSSGSCHYLLVQRPAEGLLAGLWEFPGGREAQLNLCVHVCGCAMRSPCGASEYNHKCNCQASCCCHSSGAAGRSCGSALVHERPLNERSMQQGGMTLALCQQLGAAPGLF